MGVLVMLNNTCPRCGSFLSILPNKHTEKVLCRFCGMKFHLSSDESDEDRIFRILDSKELKDLVTNDIVYETCLDFYPGKRIEEIPGRF